MFNSWSSLTSALSKRTEQRKQHQQALTKKDRSKSQCDARDRKQIIKRKPRTLSNITSHSAPADCKAVSSQTSYKQLGFTPIKIQQQKPEKSSASRFSIFNGGQRARSFSGRSKIDQRNTDCQKLNGQEILHAQVWRQAYTFACR
ncbi:uncharacterized protein [Clytia hemisphaerica]|uniref:Uncharacterized protein n=1 Tax=Clytia hemisphaerica TaxID=252671 RepID=A0A7M6DP01_9CNID